MYPQSKVSSLWATSAINATLGGSDNHKFGLLQEEKLPVMQAETVKAHKSTGKSLPAGIDDALTESQLQPMQQQYAA